MKSKMLKLFLCLIQIIFLASCSSGGSSSDDNEETEEKEFFHYVNSETGFTGTATWQASNDVEKKHVPVCWQNAYWL